MELTVGEVFFLMAFFFAFVWALLMCWAAHKQYMLGHDTWLFEHRTPDEKEIQRHKIANIKES